MSIAVPNSGYRMAAAVAVLADDGTGQGEVAPATFTLDATFMIGAFPAREYRRDDGVMFVIQRVAASNTTPKRWLVVVWTASPTRGPTLAAFAALTNQLGVNVVKAWRTVEVNGRLMVPALDADTGPVPDLVKLVWPAQWIDGTQRFIGDTLA